MIIVFIAGGLCRKKLGEFLRENWGLFLKRPTFLRYARSFFDSRRAFTDNATGCTACVSQRCVHIHSVFAQTAFDEKHK